MNATPSNPEQAARRRRRRRSALGAILLLVLAAGGGWGAWRAAHRADHAEAAQSLFEVQRGPLTISLTESGSIQSQEKVVVRSEVEGRNMVISLVDEGKFVNAGDLLVELDSSKLEEARTEQQIKVDTMEASFTEAKENLDVARNQAQSDMADADLALQFAQIDKEKFEKGEYLQQVKQAEADISIAREEHERANDRLEWSKKLSAQGYLTRIEMQADELLAKRSQLDLELADSKMGLLTNYTYRQQSEKLAADIRKATMAVMRVKRKASSDVIRAEADLRAKESEYGRQKEKLERLVTQIAKCRIVAPSEGMVVYATSVGVRRWDQDMLKTGGEVVERQELIYLPATSAMKAVVAIQEASLPKIRLGLPARIRVDALPGRIFHGAVSRIGILPNTSQAWLNPELKLYDCDINLADASADFRPGMSCRVEILVDEYEDTVFVPVQCLTRVGTQSVVYAMCPTGAVPRDVEAGLDNNRMVRIISGLAKGEKVLLAPPLPPSTVQEQDGASSEEGPQAPGSGRGRQGGDGRHAHGGGPGGRDPAPPLGALAPPPGKSPETPPATNRPAAGPVVPR